MSQVTTVAHDVEQAYWLDHLFREHARELHHRVTAIFGYDPDFAWDVVQTVFTILWRRRERYGGRRLTRQFLHRAAHNVAIDMLRSRRSTDRTHVAVANGQPRVIPPCDALLERHELNDGIGQLIDGLPPVCSEVFRLWLLEDLTQLEIAARLGIGVKRVERHFAKGQAPSPESSLRPGGGGGLTRLPLYGMKSRNYPPTPLRRRTTMTRNERDLWSVVRLLAACCIAVAAFAFGSPDRVAAGFGTCSPATEASCISSSGSVYQNKMCTGSQCATCQYRKDSICTAFGTDVDDHYDSGSGGN